MQVQKGRDQVSGGVSVPCRHATPVTDALWKPISCDISASVKMSSPVIMSQTDIMSNLYRVSLVSISRTYASPERDRTGVRRSKRLLSACHPHRKCSMENTQNSVKGRVRYKVLSVGGCHCIWSGHRMSFNICERETSYCLIRSPYRP